MGERMVDTTYCQADWDAEPKKDCGDWSNKKAVPKIKANAKMRKQTTNLILGICISGFYLGFGLRSMARPGFDCTKYKI